MSNPAIQWRSIVRSAIGIGGAAALGHVLTFLASPALSRLFTQEEFGRFGLFFSFANVLAIPATLGLQDAMLAADRLDRLDALQQAAIRLLFVSVPLLGLVAWLAIAGDWVGYGALPEWSVLLLIGEVSVLALIAVFQTRLVRERQFRVLATNHLALGAARPSSQIAAGFANGGFLGLALGELASRVVVLALLWRACGAAARAGWRSISVPDCWAAMREARAFLLYRTPSALLFNAGTALPPTLISAGYGIDAAGLYSFMFSVIVAPIGLVQKAVGDVFLGHFIAMLAVSPSQARNYFQRMVLGLLGAGTLPAAALWLYGPGLFAYVFGEPWRAAGGLASLIAPLFLCDLAIGPITGVLNAVNRPQMKLIFDVLRIAGILGAYQMARVFEAGLPEMVRWLAWSGCAGYAVYLALMWRSVSARTLPARV